MGYHLVADLELHAVAVVVLLGCRDDQLAVAQGVAAVLEAVDHLAVGVEGNVACVEGRCCNLVRLRRRGVGECGGCSEPERHHESDDDSDFPEHGLLPSMVGAVRPEGTGANYNYTIFYQINQYFVN